ncbi:MAG TPA: hypothetical protein VGE51_12545 [Fontimonas sp.]
MKARLISTYALAASALLALPLAANAHSYTYVEGGYVSLDNDAQDDSGFRIAGSGAVAPSFAVIGEYVDTGDFEQLSAGAVFHAPIDRSLDWFAGATIEMVDVPGDDDTGFGLRGGLRWSFAKAFELIPEIRHVDVFDEGFTSLRVTGLYRVAPRLDIQAALQGGDDDRFEAGLRYNF